MNQPQRPTRWMAHLLRVFFHLLYHPLAWSYDLVAALVSLGWWKDWVLSVLPALESGRVLEIGFGPGHLQGALHQKGIAALGVDPSRQMARQAYRRLQKSGFTPQLTRAQGQNLPFAAATFDQIVATFPTEHIYTPETLSEAYRTLRPGGTLLVLPAAWITGTRPLDRGAAALFRATGEAPAAWDAAQWLAPFSRAGFQTRVEMRTQKSWSLVILWAQKPTSS